MDEKKNPKFVPFSCSECGVELVDKQMSISQLVQMSIIYDINKYEN